MTKKTVIDEELVRRAIGNTPSILDAEPPPFDERIIKTVEDSDEAPQAAERRRRILLPDFERRFMARTEIRFRAAIYVDAETKRKILDVVRKIGPDRMTATSYADNILRWHLETYREEINRLHNDRNSRELLCPRPAAPAGPNGHPRKCR